MRTTFDSFDSFDSSEIYLQNNLAKFLYVMSMIVLLGCPRNVRLSYICGYTGTYRDISGPHMLQPEYFGFYKIQTGLIHGRSWYKSTGSGTKAGKAIWYDGRSKWMIGSVYRKGSTRGFAYTTSDHECPHTPGFTWKYWNSSIGEWVGAGKGLNIWNTWTTVTESVPDCLPATDW